MISCPLVQFYILILSLMIEYVLYSEFPGNERTKVALQVKANAVSYMRRENSSYTC